MRRGGRLEKIFFELERLVPDLFGQQIPGEKVEAGLNDHETEDAEQRGESEQNRVRLAFDQSVAGGGGAEDQRRCEIEDDVRDDVLDIAWERTVVEQQHHCAEQNEAVTDLVLERSKSGRNGRFALAKQILKD